MASDCITVKLTAKPTKLGRFLVETHPFIGVITYPIWRFFAHKLVDWDTVVEGDSG